MSKREPIRTAMRGVFARRIAPALALGWLLFAGMLLAQEPDPNPSPPVAPPQNNSAEALRAELDALRERYEVLSKDLADLREEMPEDRGAGRGFTFKMGGQLVIDTLWFDQDANSMAQVGDVQDTADFRRARLYATGEYGEIFSYAVGMDFAQGSGDNGRPTFLDNYLAISQLPYLGTLRIGHFFEPFTLERSGSNRNTAFMERSLVDAFAPSRNLGAMFYNQNEAQDWWWAVGGFHGASDNFGDFSGDQEGMAFDVRVVHLPYYDEPSGGRYYLHLGAGYSYRDAADGVVTYRSRPEAFGSEDPVNPATPFFVDTGSIAADHSQLAGLEFLWVNGPLIVESEVVVAPVHLDNGNTANFWGAYAFVGYFLTGEHQPYNRKMAITDRVHPFENFFRIRNPDGTISTGRGAWQVAARLSHIDLDDAGVQGGRLTDMTVGLNWFLSPYHRFKFNYILANLDSGGLQSQTSIFGMRFDVDF